MTYAFYHVDSLNSLKWYVGFFAVSHSPELFQLDHTPTDDDALPYLAIIGPFDSESEAREARA